MAVINGVGYPGCGAVSSQISAGCATKNALAVAFLFEPQWLQVYPNVNLSMPLSVTYGVAGNPAYVAGAFYAKGAKLYSIGLKATYNSNTTLALEYNGYHYDPAAKVPNGLGGIMYAGTGGNGAVALNDKAWVALVLKTSF